MKKIFFFVFVYSLIHIINSQTEKGRFIYGGTFQVTDQFASNDFWSVSFQATLSPQFGYFPVKNFAILGQLDLGYSGDFVDDHRLSYGLGPELRYYVGKGKVKFYVLANIISTGIYKPNFYFAPINEFILNTSTGPGLAVFPSSDFVIQTSLTFNTMTIVYQDPDYSGNKPTTGLSLGLKVAFNGLFTTKSKKT